MLRVCSFALAGALFLNGCGDDDKAAPPPPKPGLQLTVIPGDEPPPITNPIPTPPPEIPKKDPEPIVPTDAAYELDWVLRINEIQMKGTHNSYHLRSDHPSAPKWSLYSLPTLTEQLSTHGVRQFELDLHYYRNQFEVFHLPVLDQRSTCPVFKDCLRELRAWSDANRGHHPIFVFLELKDEWDPEKIPPHMEQLEAELLSIIPRTRLITPDDVKGTYPALQAAVQQRGWPHLGSARGKFMFIIMDEGDGRYAYTYGGKTLDGRAMFVTASGWPYGVISTIDNVTQQEDFIYESVRNAKLVRSRVDDLPGYGGDFNYQLTIALRAGAQMIATDYPVDNWIPGYVVRIPDGTPSRCNPVTAREECENLQIENPLLLKSPAWR